ncbi:S8 family serine peptidase [Microbacterium sp. P03]|uniref:S8 family serine peptidase n=1 Tax=Microbacterium sp. P03 TaxID=3366946 RepID=UPI003745EBC2
MTRPSARARRSPAASRRADILRTVAGGAAGGALLLGLSATSATAAESDVPISARSSIAAPSANTAVDGECTASTRITDPPPALDSLQSRLAWGVTRGAGVAVAIVDSGVMADGPHFSGAIAGGTDLVGDGGGAFTDTFGHGTAIAGQIAAREIDGSGIIGLAPEARILSVRVYAGIDDSQIDAGSGPTVARLAAGIRYAADERAQVITVSMSTAAPSPELADAVAYARDRGSLVIASGGNRDSTLSFEEAADDGIRYPAGDDGALGVAATDATGVVTEASIHGPHIALSAPGAQILTTSATGGDCALAGDVPATSYAAAYVAAAAALVAAAHPDETPAQWAYRLEATAVRADPDARDDVSGWGIVQPYDAIVMVPGPGIRGPVSPFPGAGATPAPDASESAVTITSQPPPNGRALQLGVLGAVVAAMLLGVIGALVVMRSRRRALAAAVDAPPQRRGAGLYRDEEPGAP